MGRGCKWAKELVRGRERVCVRMVREGQLLLCANTDRQRGPKKDEFAQVNGTTRQDIPHSTRLQSFHAATQTHKHTDTYTDTGIHIHTETLHIHITDRNRSEKGPSIPLPSLSCHSPAHSLSQTDSLQHVPPPHRQTDRQ